MPAPKTTPPKTTAPRATSSQATPPKTAPSKTTSSKAVAPKPAAKASADAGQGSAATPPTEQSSAFATGLVLAVVGFFFIGAALSGGVDSDFLGAYVLISSIILLLSPKICRSLSENTKGIYILCAFLAFVVAPLIIGSVGRAKNDEQKQIIAAEREACEADGYGWDYGDNKCDRDTETTKSRKITCEKEGKHWWSDSVGCISQEEFDQRKAKEQARRDCGAKSYYWNETADRCNTDEEQAAKKQAEEASRLSSSSSSQTPSTSTSASQWADPVAHFGETMTLTGKVRIDFAWGESVSGYKEYDKIIPQGSNNYAFWLETSSGTAYVMGGKAFTRKISNGDTLTVTGTIISDGSTGSDLWLSLD